MKLSKKEALEIYVKLYGNVSYDDYDTNDVLHRMKEYILGVEGSEEEDVDEVDEEEEDLDDEEVDEDESEEDESDDPDYDETIDDTDLAALGSCAATVNGRTVKVRFETVDGQIDLVEGKNDRIDDVRFVSRTGSTLSVYSGGCWHDLDVKKFPKEWTTLLELNAVYSVSEA